jgi:hypothetical protein
MAARFYVYVIHDGDGLPVYIGKGSGRRLEAQRKRFGRQGYVWRRFKSEDAAFAFEARCIAELSPALNRCAGGAGARVTTKAPREYRCPTAIAMQEIGPRRYVARRLFDFVGVERYIDPSKLDAIRQVANGHWA